MNRKIYGLRVLAILFPMLVALFIGHVVHKRIGPQSQGDIKYLSSLTPNSRRGIEYATESLQSSSATVRDAAAKGLGTIGRPADSATPALIAALNDPSPVVVASAAWALGNIQSHNPLVIDALIKKLGDSDGEVRRYAAYALALYGPKASQAVPALTVALQDKHMAYMAARALGEIGTASRASIPDMAALLASQKDGDRAEAAMALSQLKPLPPGIETSIVKLQQDNSKLVRDIAQRAVSNLNSAPKSFTPTARGGLWGFLEQYLY